MLEIARYVQEPGRREELGVPSILSDHVKGSPKPFFESLTMFGRLDIKVGRTGREFFGDLIELT